MNYFIKNELKIYCWKSYIIHYLGGYKIVYLSINDILLVNQIDIPNCICIGKLKIRTYYYSNTIVYSNGLLKSNMLDIEWINIFACIRMEYLIA